MIFGKKSASRSTDDELIQQYISSGDMKLLGELFIRYSHLVYGVCFKYLHNPDDSKDAVIEIFDSLSKLLKNHPIRNFKSWLYSVAKNHGLMQLRKKNVQNLSITLPENEENDLAVDNSRNVSATGNSKRIIWLAQCTCTQ